MKKLLLITTAISPIAILSSCAQQVKSDDSKKIEDIKPNNVQENKEKEENINNKEQNTVNKEQNIKEEDKKVDNDQTNNENKIENQSVSYQNKLENIKLEINDFIATKLNNKKYEYSKDVLQSNVDDINYNLVLNKNTNENEYKNYYLKLNNVFSDVRSNYEKNIQNTNNLSDEDKNNKKDDKKDDAESAEKTLTNYDLNLKSNIESNDFINLIDKDKIGDIEYIGYTLENKQKIKDFTMNLVKDLEKDDEKIKAIFDYITANVKYAFDPKIQPAIEPYDVLQRKVAVCGGYSNLYKAMLDSIGIKNSIVIGWSKYGDHQWNLVYDSLNNKFFHSDPTWGRGYFRKNEKDFANDHRTFKLIDTYFEKNNVLYEYDRGVSVYANVENSNNLYEDTLSPSLPVKNISENYLKTVDDLEVKPNIEKINYLGGSHNIKKINVDQNNQAFSSLDNILYDKTQSTLLKVPEKYESNKLILPKTVKQIEDSKLSLKAKSLSKIEVQAGSYWLREYGGLLYNNDLSDLVFIPNNSPSTILTSDNLILKSHDFSFNDNIETIILGKNVADVPEFAFNKLGKLKTIIFNGKINSFSQDAFVTIDLNKVNLIFKKGISQNALNVIKKLKVEYEISNS